MGRVRRKPIYSWCVFLFLSSILKRCFEYTHTPPYTCTKAAFFFSCLYLTGEALLKLLSRVMISGKDRPLSLQLPPVRRAAVMRRNPVAAQGGRRAIHISVCLIILVVALINNYRHTEVVVYIYRWRHTYIRTYIHTYIQGKIWLCR